MVSKKNPWIAPGIIVTLLMFGSSLLGSYIGRVRAEAANNSTILLKLDELSKKADENSKRVELLDERLRTQVVSKEMFDFFVDSQKAYSTDLKEQIQSLGRHK